MITTLVLLAGLVLLVALHLGSARGDSDRGRSGGPAPVADPGTPSASLSGVLTSSVWNHTMRHAVLHARRTGLGLGTVIWVGVGMLIASYSVASLAAGVWPAPDKRAFGVGAPGLAAFALGIAAVLPSRWSAALMGGAAAGLITYGQEALPWLLAVGVGALVGAASWWSTIVPPGRPFRRVTAVPEIALVLLIAVSVHQLDRTGAWLGGMGLLWWMGFVLTSRQYWVNDVYRRCGLPDPDIARPPETWWPTLLLDTPGRSDPSRSATVRP